MCWQQYINSLFKTRILHTYGATVSTPIFLLNDLLAIRHDNNQKMNLMIIYDRLHSYLSVPLLLFYAIPLFALPL